MATKVVSSPFPSKAVRTLNATEDAVIITSESGALATDAKLDDIIANQDDAEVLLGRLPDGVYSKSLTRNYATLPVSSSWVLLGSIPNGCSQLYIFDSSGETVDLAIGYAGLEEFQFVIPPGGENYKKTFPVNTLISIRRHANDLTVGEIVITAIT